MWSEVAFNPLSSCVDNNNNSFCLFVEYYQKSVFQRKFVDENYKEGTFEHPKLFSEFLPGLAKIENKNPLFQLNKEEKKMLWVFRDHLINFPTILPRFLDSVDWTDYSATQEVYFLLKQWKLPNPHTALQLLHRHISDPVIHKFTAQVFEKFSDSQILDFLPQLVQVLKQQNFHDSPLACFLIKRAFRNRHRIGHALFWHLKSELHVPIIVERFSIILECYLRGCGTHRKEILKQHQVVDSLVSVAVRIKNVSNPAKRKVVLHEELKKIKFPGVFQLPLNPRYEVKGLQIENCRFMDSKKIPLWLVFDNAEEGLLFNFFPRILVSHLKNNDFVRSPSH